MKLPILMPYPGLRPFEEHEESIFFGRAEQAADMLMKLAQQRFLAVVGSSGSGKSSLVRAKVIPNVRRGRLDESLGSLVVAMRPGHSPYRRLARTLIQSSMEGGASSPGGPPAFDEVVAGLTSAVLRKSEMGFVKALRECGVDPSRTRVLLVVDQFEELFGFRLAGGNRNLYASRDEASAFVGMLMASSVQQEIPIRVIITMRSDFVGHCEVFLGLPERVSDSQFLVPRLDWSQMREAIVRPSQVTGEGFHAFHFEAGLVDRIINDAGDRPDQLPLMQHALMRTWKEAANGAANQPVCLTLKHYETVGGIARALHLHANDAWAKIEKDPKRAAIAERLFVLLSDESPDGQIIRRRAQVSEVVELAKANLKEVGAVVRLFQEDGRNFLLPVLPPDRELEPDQGLDLCHEALLRQWETYRKWQDEERTRVAELRRLVEQARLHAQGEEGLLGEKSLERVQKWRETASREWACRYGRETDWQAGLAFIDESQAQLELDRQKTQEERWKVTRKEKRLKGIIVGLILLAAGLAILTGLWAKHEQAKAKEKTDTASKHSEEAKQKEESARKAMWDAAEARKMAAQDTARAQQEFQQATQAVRKAWEDTRNATNAIAQARQASLNAERHQILRFVGGIGLGYASPSREEWQALWDLAELPPESDSIRLQVLTNWFVMPEYLDRALKGNGLGLRAGVGLDWNRHGVVQVLAVALMERTLTNRLTYLPDAARWSTLADWLDRRSAERISGWLTDTLEHAPESEPSRLWSLGKTLGSTVTRMDAGVALPLAKRGTAALVESLVDPQVDWSAFVLRGSAELNQALADMIPRMSPTEIPPMAERIAEALEHTQETKSYRLVGLAQSLGIFTSQMNDSEAGSLASRGLTVLVKAVDNPKFNTYILGLDSIRFTHSLSNLTRRLTAGESAKLADQIISGFETARDRDPDVLMILDQVLDALAPRTNPDDLRPFAERVLRTMENRREMDMSNLFTIARALTSLAARFKESEAAPLASRGVQVILDRLENPRREYSLSFLSDTADDARTLGDLVSRMNTDDLATVTERISTAIFAAPRARPQRVQDDPDDVVDALGESTEANRLSVLARGLGSCSARIEARQVAPLAEKIIKALEDGQKTNLARLSIFDPALGVLAQRMNDQEAAMLATRGTTVLVEAMESPQMRVSRDAANRSSSLDHALGALALRMNANDVPPLAGRIVKLLVTPRQTAPDRLKTLGTAVVSFSTRLGPGEASPLLEQIIKALENSQDTAPDRLKTLVAAMVSFSTRLNPMETASLGARIIRLLDDPRERDPDRLEILSQGLAALTKNLPEAVQFTRFALAQLLANSRTPLNRLASLSIGDERSSTEAASDEENPEPLERRLVRSLCQRLEATDLAEVLKWPSCSAENARVALEVIEDKLKKQGTGFEPFQGDVWRFVAEAGHLGLTKMSRAPTQPKAGDALQELAKLAGKTPQSP